MPSQRHRHAEPSPRVETAVDLDDAVWIVPVAAAHLALNGGACLSRAAACGACGQELVHEGLRSGTVKAQVRAPSLGQLPVDGLPITCTQRKPRPWCVPHVPPTHKQVAVDMVVVVQFRGDPRACARIYWDHAAVRQYVGLLPAEDAAHHRQEGPHADARSRRT